MCLYPKLIRNKRFQMYNLHAGDTPITDERKLWVAAGCGKCIECRKQKAREWQVRLNEEIKCHKYNYFITLTFSPEAIKKFCEEDAQCGRNVNFLARKAVRRFLERYRKKYGHSVKHWLITELGQTNTERIHIHGILMLNNEMTNDELNSLWKYGKTDNGEYCNERTIGYIVKYITKVDPKHKTYEPDIFCSAGIGKAYIENDFNKWKHRFRGNDTCQTYTLPDGSKIALPIYYRNHLFTQKERDELWTITLNNDRTFVRGIECERISTPEGYKKYIDILKGQQRDNELLGFGNQSKEWKEEDYKVTFEMINNSPKTEK